MAVKRYYTCDLCDDSPRKKVTLEPDLIGLKWVSGGVLEAADYPTVERHICVKCLSSLQAFEPVCRHGFSGCTGGPRCQSDHK